MAKLIFERDNVRVWIEPVGSNASGAAAQQAAKQKLLTEIIGEPDLWHTAEGAPYIEGSSATVSLTHCASVVALAIDASGRRIGVDAEKRGRDVQLRRVAPRFLSEAQMEEWTGSDDALLMAWTLKEALYKACRIPGWPLCKIALPRLAEMSEAGRSVFSLVCDGENAETASTFVCYELEIEGFDGIISLVREVF